MRSKCAHWPGRRWRDGAPRPGNRQRAEGRAREVDGGGVPPARGAGEGRRVMAWNDGLEYLKVPEWRMAFDAADVIFGVDVTTGQRFLVFGRAALATSEGTDV